MSARPDPDAFANLLCEWCLDARPEQQVPCRSPVHGLPLVRALHAAVLERDAWPLIRITPDGIGEAFYRHARERHLDAFAPLELLETQTADAVLGIDAPANTRELAGVDPELIARAARARQPVQEACLSKRWCGTLWPTSALAQQAGMSDGEYAAFVTRALFLDRPDPLRAWTELSAAQARIIERLSAAREILGISSATCEAEAGSRPTDTSSTRTGDSWSSFFATLTSPTPPVMRRTKIVATIGPASRNLETLTRMVAAGVDVVRLNFSHGDRDEHAENADLVRKAASAAGRQVAILQDLPGPKIRIGALTNDLAELKPGETLVLACGTNGLGTQQWMSVSWGGLATAVDPDDVVYLADGAIRLRVKAVRAGDGEIEAAVEIGGTVASRQGLNIPGSTRGVPAVPEEDLDMLRFGESIGVDLVALSFVRTAEDVSSVRRHTRLPLIAKIEKPQAVDSAEEIIRSADCVMVARGDLGIELPIEDVPMVQKQLLRIAGRLARPSITATQMLDSMVSSPRPTRAEVADVANAILDGTDAVMLSAETAIGSYPVQAVEMMASVAERAEQSLPYRAWNEERVRRDARDPAYTVAYSACAAARELHLAALVVPTLSGRSARLLSAHRPQVPIYALSPGRETVRRCSLMWGVQASSMRRHEITEALIADAARRVVELGWVKSGARVGITAGLPSGRPGTTSLVQIQRV